MDSILILVFFGIPVGLGLLFYFVPKKLGYHKTAKYLTISYGLSVVTIGLLVAFEDELFNKNNAKELVEEQDLKLTDEFVLIKNESMSSFGDYYHTFTLKISQRDKQNAISKIKNSENFWSAIDSIPTVAYQSGNERSFGEKVTQNYETDDSFVREYFEPSQREGYAPTFRRILISKTKNELTFQDIDD